MYFNIIFVKSIKTVITKADAHAEIIQLSYGEPAYWNIVTVKDGIGSFIFSDKYLLLNDVNKSGAVSPATRAIARETPVKIPVNALFKIISFIIYL